MEISLHWIQNILSNVENFLSLICRSWIRLSIPMNLFAFCLNSKNKNNIYIYNMFIYKHINKSSAENYRLLKVNRKVCDVSVSIFCWKMFVSENNIFLKMSSFTFSFWFGVYLFFHVCLILNRWVFCVLWFLSSFAPEASVNWHELGCV